MRYNAGIWLAIMLLVLGVLLYNYDDLARWANPDTQAVMGVVNDRIQNIEDKRVHAYHQCVMRQIAMCQSDPRNMTCHDPFLVQQFGQACIYAGQY